MTTFVVPPAGAAAWREIYPVPPLLRLETVGPWCPIDDARLEVSETGWACTRCSAAWDFRGEHPRWPDTPARRRPFGARLLSSAALIAAALTPTRRRPSGAMTAGLLTAAALIGFGLALALGEAPQHLLLLAAALLAVATVVIVAFPLYVRVADWRRFRHNRVLRVVDGRVVDGEVVRR